jgi:hypothetical protein
MKIIALLLLLLGIVLLICISYLLATFFAYSFEPWTRADWNTRLIRVGIVAVGLAFLLLVGLGWWAYLHGDYPLALRYVCGYLLLIGAGFVFNFAVRHTNRGNLTVQEMPVTISPDEAQQLAREAAIQPLYFARQLANGHDTITVLPNGQVNYRRVVAGQAEVRASVGYLGPRRDELHPEWVGDGELDRDEYPQFKDAAGQSLVDLFPIR